MSNEVAKTTSVSTRILTAEEVAKEVFGGKKSSWGVLALARRREIPHFKLGRRIFFDGEALKLWMDKQMAASITPQAASNGAAGIRRLK